MDDAPVHADPAVGVGQPAAAGAQPPGAHAPHAAIPVNQPAGYHIPVVPLEPAVYAAAAALPAGRILLSGMPTITVSSPPNPEAVRIALEKLTEWRSMTHQVAVLPMSKLLRVASVSNEVDIWVSRYNRAYPEATDDDIVNAFLERFAPEEMEPTSTPPAKRPCYAEAVRSNRRPTAAPVSAPRANRGPSSSTVRRPSRTLPQRSQQQRPRQQRPQPQHNPLELTRFKDLDGKRINFATYQAMLRGNVCFNCFEPGHHSRECRAPPKPYPDEPRPA
jgi:hypothetical protein